MTRLQDGSEWNQDLFPSRDWHLTQVHSIQTKSEAHPPSICKGNKRLSAGSWGVQLIIHLYTMLRLWMLKPPSTPPSMWYFRFSKQCCQWFRPSRMWCYITGWVAADISKQNDALIFQGQAQTLEYLTCEDEHTIFLQNTSNHSPNDSVTSQKSSTLNSLQKFIKNNYNNINRHVRIEICVVWK